MVLTLQQRDKIYVCSPQVAKGRMQSPSLDFLGKAGKSRLFILNGSGEVGEKWGRSGWAESMTGFRLDFGAESKREQLLGSGADVGATPQSRTAGATSAVVLVMDAQLNLMQMTVVETDTGRQLGNSCLQINNLFVHECQDNQLVLSTKSLFI